MTFHLQGEDQKKLDIVANEVFINVLRRSGQCSVLVGPVLLLSCLLHTPVYMAFPVACSTTNDLFVRSWVNTAGSGLVLHPTEVSSQQNFGTWNSKLPCHSRFQKRLTKKSS